MKKNIKNEERSKHNILITKLHTLTQNLTHSINGEGVSAILILS